MTIHQPKRYGTAKRRVPGHSGVVNAVLDRDAATARHDRDVILHADCQRAAVWSDAADAYVIDARTRVQSASRELRDVRIGVTEQDVPASGGFRYGLWAIIPEAPAEPAVSAPST